MHFKTYLLTAVLCGASLCAQTQTQPTPTAPPKPPDPSSSDTLQRETYVRRFSGGLSLSVLALGVMKGGTTGTLTTTPPVDAIYTTTALTPRVGYGVNLQIAVSDHFAVAGSLLMRPKNGYQMNSDILEGTDIISTPQDERRNTVKNEDTRARFYDLPVTLRYFRLGRQDPGPRWFVEGGAALRRVAKIRTSVDSTVGNNATVCCDNTPAPATNTIRGLVAGAGVQLIDPVGLRIVPSVRYTRWTGATFNNHSTVSPRNQIEAIISIGF